MSEAIVGLASVFYRAGDSGTQFELWPGAVERVSPTTFDGVLRDGADVAGLVNHDANQLLARRSAGNLFLRTDATGLQVEIYPAATGIGRDAIENVRARNLSGMSFSFAIRDEKWSRENGLDVRTLLDVQMYDCGPVTFPAYKSTTATVAVGDRLRSSALASYARRAAQLNNESRLERNKMNVLVERAGQRRDSQRSQILANAKRLLLAKQAAIVRDNERLETIRDPHERELCQRAIERASKELETRVRGLREVGAM